MGAPLLRRTTRSLRLTEAGERYLLVARRVLADLDEAERTTGTALSEPKGLLFVTAPVAFGSLHVRPIVDDFLARHPGARVQFLLLDRVVSVIEEGLDIAVRIGHLPDSALLATALGSVRRVVVASPEYLARHGRPREPQELVGHRCIVPTALMPQDGWSFGKGKGARARRVRVEPVLSVNTTVAAIASAVSGVGITCALSYQVTEQLQHGTLVRLLPAFEPTPMPVHLLCPAASARTAKVRAFVELAVPALRAALDFKVVY